MNRRTLLKCALTCLSAAAMVPAARMAFAATPKTGARSVEDLQKNWKTFLPTGAADPTPSAPVKLADAEWKKRLPAEAYDVLRHEGTEYPGTSPLNNEKREGVFACAGCGQPLFTSAMKFDSGTGWPSFFTAIPGTLETKRDFGMILPRTEYHCSKCGGHHGHLFNDGPKPTGLRYCNNGVALKFISKTGTA